MSLTAQQERARLLLKQRYEELANQGELHDVAMRRATEQVIEQMRIENFYGRAGYGPEEAMRLEKKRLLLGDAITNSNWKAP